MKKTAAVLLAMIMMLFAMGALAAVPTVAGAGVSYTYADNVLTLKSAGEYTVSGWNDGDGVPTEGRIEINSDVSGAVTLKIEDVHLDAPEDYALKWTNNQQGVNCTLTVEFANSSLEGKGGMCMINRLGSASMTVAGANAMITGNEYGAVSVFSVSGSAVVTVSGENASFSGTTDGISAQGQKVTTNVTGANAMISAEGFGISAESQEDTEVSVTGAGAVVEGDYGIYVDSDGSAAVNVEGIKRITAETRGVSVKAETDTMLNVTDVEEITSTGDFSYAVYAGAMDGDMTLNVRNVGKIAGKSRGLYATSSFGNAQAYVADVQEIDSDFIGISVFSQERDSALTLGGNVTATGSEAVMVKTRYGYGTVKLDRENYPGIAAQLYKNETDEEPEKTLTALNAEELKAYHKVRTVLAPKAAGLPATGDDSQLALYMAMLGIAAAALLAQRGLRRE